jgi:hypothetical protein
MCGPFFLFFQKPYFFRNEREKKQVGTSLSTMMPRKPFCDYSGSAIIYLHTVII